MGGGGFDEDAIGLYLGDGADLDAPVAGVAAADDGLVVDAGEEVRAEAA